MLYIPFLLIAGGWSAIGTLSKWTLQIRSPSYNGKVNVEPDLS